MKISPCLILIFAAHSATAEILVPAIPIRAGTIIQDEHIEVLAGVKDNALDEPAQAVGLQAKRNLYPGRPIMQADLRPPAVIRRNSIVEIIYQVAGLRITTSGRAIEEASIGESVRVINSSSRRTIEGVAVGVNKVTVYND